MNDPMVSVIMPTYNRLRHLRATVASVLAQTFGRWELIVADDGSDEETLAFLKSLSEHPRVRLLQLPHSGNPVMPRNAGMRAARGEYIAFLDSDDVWLPQKLALQVESLERHRSRGWGHTAFTLIDDAGTVLCGDRARTWSAAEGWVLDRLVKMETVIAVSSTIFRRSLIERTGGFDAGVPVCEDYDLWLRAAGLSEIDGIRDTLLHKRVSTQPYYSEASTLQERRQSLGKVLAASGPGALRSLLRRERAKLAAQLARNQAVLGGRGAALRTLARTALSSWTFREWWWVGAYAAARALAPASVVHIARTVARRG